MQTLTLMNLTPPTIKKASPKSIDLMQNTKLLFNNPFHQPIIKLWRIKIFKTDFRNLTTWSKFWE